MKKRAGKSKTYFDSHGETHQTTATRTGEQEAEGRRQAAESGFQGAGVARTVWLATTG